MKIVEEIPILKEDSLFTKSEIDNIISSIIHFIMFTLSVIIFGVFAICVGGIILKIADFISG